MKIILLSLSIALGVAAPQKQAPGQETKDPVCGMKVKKETKLKSVYKEKTHGFCSKSCKDKFDANPEKYVKK